MSKKRGNSFSLVTDDISQLVDLNSNLKELTEHIDEVIWVTNLENGEKIEYVTPSFKKIWGYEVKKLYANSRIWTESIHKEDIKSVQEAFSKFISGKGEYNVRYRINDSSGKTKWILDRAKLVKNSSGKIVRAIGVASDVSDLQESLVKYESLSQRFKLAVDSAKIGVWDWDVVNDVLVWDDNMYRTYHIKRQDFKGAFEAWKHGLYPDDKDVAIKEVELAIQGKKHFDTRFRIVWPDKSIHLIEAHGEVVRDENDKPLKMIGVNWEVPLDTSLDSKSSDFLSLAKRRKTTFEFSDREVSENEVMKMLEAARWAPSCSNTQPWGFVVIRNEKTIDELMKTVNYGFFHSNPKLIIACVLRNDRCAGPGYACFRGIDSAVHDSFMSVGIAAYNICLEAEDLNIASCILTPDQKSVKKVLSVPNVDAVPLMVGIGYEKAGAYKRKRARFELKDIMSYESATKKVGSTKRK